MCASIALTCTCVKKSLINVVLCLCQTRLEKSIWPPLPGQPWYIYSFRILVIQPITDILCDHIPAHEAEEETFPLFLTFERNFRFCSILTFSPLLVCVHQFSRCLLNTIRCGSEAPPTQAQHTLASRRGVWRPPPTEEQNTVHVMFTSRDQQLQQPALVLVAQYATQRSTQFDDQQRHYNCNFHLMSPIFEQKCNKYTTGIILVKMFVLVDHAALLSIRSRLSQQQICSMLAINVRV